MEKLGMKTKDISKEKFEILKELFPNAVTEKEVLMMRLKRLLS